MHACMHVLHKLRFASSLIESRENDLIFSLSIKYDMHAVPL